MAIDFEYGFGGAFSRRWIGGSLDGCSEVGLSHKMCNDQFVCTAYFRDEVGMLVVPEHELIRPYWRDATRGYPRALQPGHNHRDKTPCFRKRVDQWQSCVLELYTRSGDIEFVYTLTDCFDLARCTGTVKGRSRQCFYPATPGFDTCPFHGPVDPDLMSESQLVASSFQWR